MSRCAETKHGWQRRLQTGYARTVRLEVEHVDVVAERGDARLYAEVKGRTTDAGLGVDTAYGQLLRRVIDTEPGTVQYGIVVPTGAVKAALRVPGLRDGRSEHRRVRGGRRRHGPSALGISNGRMSRWTYTLDSNALPGHEPVTAC